METMNMMQSMNTETIAEKQKLKRPRKIIVPQDQKLLEMFTTDINRIQMYIDSSPFADRMDAKVIRDINEHANKLSFEDFDDYLDDLEYEKSSMVAFFQNTIENNARIHKIHRTLVSGKKNIKEEDALYIMNWGSTNHSNFRFIHLGERQPYQYEYDESDLSVNSEYENMFNETILNNNITRGIEPCREPTEWLRQNPALASPVPPLNMLPTCKGHSQDLIQDTLLLKGGTGEAKAGVRGRSPQPLGAVGALREP